MGDKSKDEIKVDGENKDKLIETLEKKLKELSEIVEEFRQQKTLVLDNKPCESEGLKKEIAYLKTRCRTLEKDIKNIIDAPEWGDFFRVVEKLNLLTERVAKFIEMFSRRKQLSEEFLKKIDYLIMNEAIKYEMVSHIFEMLNRGESKEKIMNASLEFVYFLKEIENEETLSELKNLKDFIITSKREEANLAHFLDKLTEKLTKVGEEVAKPIEMVDELKALFQDIQGEFSSIGEELEKIKKQSDSPSKSRG